MKKTVSLLIALLLLATLSLTGCQKQEDTTSTSQTTAQSQTATQATTEFQGTVDYGRSKIYSENDLDAAIDMIEQEVGMWDELTLKSIRYAGDESVTDENLKKMKELDSSQNFTQVCQILTDLEVAENAPGGIWEPGKTYKDYSWWLARTDGGQWSLLTWGAN